MLLVLTSLDDSTADYLCNRLEAESIDFLRLNTDAECSAFSVSYDARGPRLITSHRSFSPSDLTSIWLRRPKPIAPLKWSDPAEGAFVAQEQSEAIEGFLAHVPRSRWVNHPSSNALASRKLEQLTRATEFALKIPATLLTQSPEQLMEFWIGCEGRIIVKPLSSGYLERSAPSCDSQIFTNQVSKDKLQEAIGDLSRCPTLFQSLIDKSTDVRITLLDDDVHAIALHAEDNGSQRVDIRRDNMEDVRYESISMPAVTRDAILQLVRSYGLRFAAVDMVISKTGEWVFLEINPNGQWAWMDLDGASDIASSFVRAFGV